MYLVMFLGWVCLTVHCSHWHDYHKYFLVFFWFCLVVCFCICFVTVCACMHAWVHVHMHACVVCCFGVVVFLGGVVCVCFLARSVGVGGVLFLLLLLLFFNCWCLFCGKQKTKTNHNTIYTITYLLHQIKNGFCFTGTVRYLHIIKTKRRIRKQQKPANNSKNRTSASLWRKIPLRSTWIFTQH